MKRQAFNKPAQSSSEKIDQFVASLPKGAVDAMGGQNVLVPSVRDKDGTGYDIFSLLLKQRIVVVQGQVETAMAGVIVAQLKFLEDLDPAKPITMLVNSPGGSVIDGMAIFDMMREIKCPIRTVGNGMQASMGSILLAGGDTRAMTKNSRVLVHQIMGGAAGGTQHTDFEISAASMAELHETLKSVYVEFTGLNHKFWDVVGERDTWLTADQALAIGFVNAIVQNEKPGGKYAADAKRPKDLETRKGQIDDINDKWIANASAEQILKEMNSGSANGGDISRHRGDLIVRLAQFPEFWTPTLAAEKGLKAQAASADASVPANDDKQATKPVSKKAPKGPSAA